MLNWLVAASKLHKHSGTCCTVDCPVATVDSLYCGVTKKLLTKDLLLKDEIFALEKRSEDISVEPASLAPGRSVSEPEHLLQKHNAIQGCRMIDNCGCKYSNIHVHRP